MIIKDCNIVHGIYGIDDLRGFFDVVVENDSGCFCIREEKSKNSSWRYFAILCFSSSNTDGTDKKYECFWFGEGPTNPLRECRHSYFGSSATEIDGYVFYINKKLMMDAFEFLSTYYDLG